jgi:hypothetical protein
MGFGITFSELSILLNVGVSVMASAWPFLGQIEAVV